MIEAYVDPRESPERTPFQEAITNLFADGMIIAQRHGTSLTDGREGKTFLLSAEYAERGFKGRFSEIVLTYEEAHLTTEGVFEPERVAFRAIKQEPVVSKGEVQILATEATLSIQAQDGAPGLLVTSTELSSLGAGFNTEGYAGLRAALYDFRAYENC